MSRRAKQLSGTDSEDQLSIHYLVVSLLCVKIAFTAGTQVNGPDQKTFLCQCILHLGHCKSQTNLKHVFYILCLYKTLIENSYNPDGWTCDKANSLLNVIDKQQKLLHVYLREPHECTWINILLSFLQLIIIKYILLFKASCTFKTLKSSLKLDIY